ncbi:MAG: DUF72 domain-containing protein [Thermotogae bacterium]|nr:DUF72 domain-containing protein [Thermotogota bacterium]
MIYLGTSGFSFKDWVGTVYPQDIRRSGMLRYYALEWKFNAVELNFTYYAPLSARTAVSLLRKTPSDFVFTVKLPGPVTHEFWKTGDSPNTNDTLTKFLESLKPFDQEGRTKVLLAQFPWSFQNRPETVEYLKSLKTFIRSRDLAVEFRHGSWVDEKVYELMGSLHIAHVIADEPMLDALYPYIPRITSKIAYFRFHGRNPNWFHAFGSERYNYDYSEEELKSFAKDIKKAARSAEDVFIFFNNCFNGKAVLNGLTLRKLLQES